MLFISPPFGNYFQYKEYNVHSILGTYTLHKRGGLLRRLYKLLTTVRYNRRQRSWINKMGLPNPGLEALPYEKSAGKIISIHGFNRYEWDMLVNLLPNHASGVEFNLSCPNVEHAPLLDDIKYCIISRLIGLNSKILICKLPPLRWMDLAVPLYNIGVRWFHLCNTIATPGGGISGKPLKAYSLWAIDELRQKYGEAVTLIGGGGISCLQDVKDYLQAGANHVAVGSMLFNPFNWAKPKRFAEYLDLVKPASIV